MLSAVLTKSQKMSIGGVLAVKLVGDRNEANCHRLDSMVVFGA